MNNPKISAHVMEHSATGDLPGMASIAAEAINPEAENRVNATRIHKALIEHLRGLWTQTPPTLQGEYWHWNGDEDSAPIGRVSTNRC